MLATTSRNARTNYQGQIFVTNISEVPAEIVRVQQGLKQGIAVRSFALSRKQQGSTGNSSDVWQMAPMCRSLGTSEAQKLVNIPRSFYNSNLRCLSPPTTAYDSTDHSLLAS